MPLGYEQAGRRYLLAIGVGEYADGRIRNLSTPDKDVDDLACVLRDEYAFDHIYLLKNEDGDERPERRAILTRISAYANEHLSTEDSLVVYFAGHGVILRGDGYWIPSDGIQDDDTTFVPVSDLVSRLIALPSKTVLVADCCFGGAAADETHWNAVYEKRLSGKQHQLTVIASGRSIDSVPDGNPGENSPFAAALIEILREEPDGLDLYSFLSEVKKKLTPELAEHLTQFSSLSGDTFRHVFRRKDPLGPQLRKAFLKLDYNNQEKQMNEFEAQPFNLVYLKGTKYCGHHLFLHRFFEEWGQKISLFVLPRKYVLRLRACEYGNAGESLWELIALQYYGEKYDPQRLYLQFIEEIRRNHFFLLIILDSAQEEKRMEMLVCDFWKELNTLLKDESIQVPREGYYFFLFVLDRRGEEGGDEFQEKTFQNITCTQRASELFFTQIEKIKKNTLSSWYNKQKSCMQSDKFKCLPLDGFQEDSYIQHTIKGVCDYCGTSKPYDDLFLKHWIVK